MVPFPGSNVYLSCYLVILEGIALKLQDLIRCTVGLSKQKLGTLMINKLPKGKKFSWELIFANFFGHIADINCGELGFTEDFTGINFRELSLSKDFAAINFRESALFKD